MKTIANNFEALGTAQAQSHLPSNFQTIDKRMLSSRGWELVVDAEGREHQHYFPETHTFIALAKERKNHDTIYLIKIIVEKTKPTKKNNNALFKYGPISTSYVTKSLSRAIRFYNRAYEIGAIPTRRSLPAINKAASKDGNLTVKSAKTYAKSPNPRKVPVAVAKIDKNKNISVEIEYRYK